MLSGPNFHVELESETCPSSVLQLHSLWDSEIMSSEIYGSCKYGSFFCQYIFVIVYITLFKFIES